MTNQLFRNSFLKEADEYKWLWLIYVGCIAGRKSSKVMKTQWIIKAWVKEWQLSVIVWQIEPLLTQWIFYDMRTDWSLWHLILATFSPPWCSVWRRRALRAHESACKLETTVFWGLKWLTPTTSLLLSVFSSRIQKTISFKSRTAT